MFSYHRHLLQHCFVDYLSNIPINLVRTIIVTAVVQLLENKHLKLIVLKYEALYQKLQNNLAVVSAIIERIIDRPIFE